jgi:UMF1 family MFS transporter
VGGGQAARSGAARILERLVLARPETRAWALYDWANSAFFTVVITAVWPVYFATFAAAELDADERRRAFMLTTTIALVLGALLSPVLGSLADCRPWKKRLFALGLALGAGATAGLALVGPGGWRPGLWLFGLANLGAVVSFVFYDALLVHVARPDETDRLSTTGYALGYLGGGLCLALAVLLVVFPGRFGLPSGEGLEPARASVPARASFLLVAAWWVLFSLPLLRRVREPPIVLRPGEAGALAVGAAFRRLWVLLRELRRQRQAFLMLVGFLIYNDGIGTIIRAAVLFGEERRVPATFMLGAVLGVQLLGIPCTIAFGRLAGRIGAKRAILVGLAGYVLACGVALGLDTTSEFVVLAVLVAAVQGGCQALSRSLFASLVPAHRSGEFFGLFAALEKFAGVLGPAAFAASPTGGGAILAVLGFFLVGGFLLSRVDVESGRAEARAAERAVRASAPVAG